MSLPPARQCHFLLLVSVTSSWSSQYRVQTLILSLANTTINFLKFFFYQLLHQKLVGRVCVLVLFIMRTEFNQFTSVTLPTLFQYTLKNRKFVHEVKEATLLLRNTGAEWIFTGTIIKRQERKRGQSSCCANNSIQVQSVQISLFSSDFTDLCWSL